MEVFSYLQIQDVVEQYAKCEGFVYFEGLCVLCSIVETRGEQVLISFYFSPGDVDRLDERIQEGMHEFIMSEKSTFITVAGTNLLKRFTAKLNETTQCKALSGNKNGYVVFLGTVRTPEKEEEVDISFVPFCQLVRSEIFLTDHFVMDVCHYFSFNNP